MRKSNLGQGEVFTAAATAAANAGVSVYHAAKVSKLQQKFQSKLDQDEIDMDFIRALLARFRSTGTRLAQTTTARPGTPDFDKLLMISTKEDMKYKGNCNAAIYNSRKAEDKLGQPREIWADIDRSGHITQPNRLPLDIGVIWASGCKNAQDEFRTTWVQGYKGDRRYAHVRDTKFDIKTLNVFLKYGGGLLLVVALLVMIKLQSAVISEQQSIQTSQLELSTQQLPAQASSFVVDLF